MFGRKVVHCSGTATDEGGTAVDASIGGAGKAAGGRQTALTGTRLTKDQRRATGGGAMELQLRGTDL